MDKIQIWKKTKTTISEAKGYILVILMIDGYFERLEIFITHMVHLMHSR